VAVATGRQGLPAERIGETVHHALTTTRPKVRYTVTPTWIQQWLVDHLPRRVLDRIVANKLGLRRRGST